MSVNMSEAQEYMFDGNKPGIPIIHIYKSVIISLAEQSILLPHQSAPLLFAVTCVNIVSRFNTALCVIRTFNVQSTIKPFNYTICLYIMVLYPLY